MSGVKETCTRPGLQHDCQTPDPTSSAHARCERSEMFSDKIALAGTVFYLKRYGFPLQLHT